MGYVHVVRRPNVHFRQSCNCGSSRLPVEGYRQINCPKYRHIPWKVTANQEDFTRENPVGLPSHWCKGGHGQLCPDYVRYVLSHLREPGYCMVYLSARTARPTTSWPLADPPCQTAVATLPNNFNGICPRSQKAQRSFSAKLQLRIVPTACRGLPPNKLSKVPPYTVESHSQSRGFYPRKSSRLTEPLV